MNALAQPTPSPVARLLLSELEAAAVLGVSVRTMLTLRARDRLPFVRLGTRVLYRPGDLAAWVDARRTIATGTVNTGTTTAARLEGAR